jgi:hypothetical protein
MILKVDLVGDKDLKILLILLNKYYTDHYTKRNLFVANDGFTIYRGNLFLIFKTGCIHVPKNFIIGIDNINRESFNSDKERYEYLKRLQKALLEWSKSEFWFGFTEENKIRLTFRDKVWLLF